MEKAKSVENFTWLDLEDVAREKLVMLKSVVS